MEIWTTVLVLTLRMGTGGCVPTSSSSHSSASPWRSMPGNRRGESTWRVQAWMQEAFDHLCPEELLSEYGLLLWAMQSPYNIEMLVHISNNKSGWFLVGVELCHNSDFFMDRISRCSQGVVGFHFSNIQMKLTVTQVRSATWNYLKSFPKWFHNWIYE